MDILASQYQINTKPMFRLDNINVFKLLGAGSFSQVYLAQNTQTNQLVAIRSIKKFNQQNIEYLNRIKKKDKIDKFGCSKMLGLINNKYMAMQLHGPSLLKRIEECGPLSEKETLQFVIRTATTLDWLQNVCKLAHGDLSPMNFVFDTIDDYPHNLSNVRLIDFDSLKPWDYVEEKSFGTFVCASPENNEGKPYQYRANDAFAFGKVINFCATGRRNLTSQNKGLCSETISKIIGFLTAYNPEKRASYRIIINIASNRINEI